MSSGSTTRLEVHELLVAAHVEVARLVEDVRDAAAHPGGEVPPCRAQHYHAPVGHVLAAVVAHAIDRRRVRRCCGHRSVRPLGRG